MTFVDFVVKYDPETTTPEELTKRILYSVVIKRLKHHKPCIMFVGGDSGEGKSISSVRLQEMLLEIQGLDINEYFNDINVYTPLEYPTKLEALLYDKRLKKVNILCMHEAREVVKAKNWQSFLTQSVADVNAMSRAVKRLCIIVISQFIRDITSDIRYTINFYIKVTRPRGRHARLYWHVMWKDDRDLEKPKLRKRKLVGYLVYPNGRYRRYRPEYLELKKPAKELVEKFEQADYNAKSGIIKKKLQKLINEMKADIGEENHKLLAMVEWYSKRPEELTKIGKRRGKKLALNKNFTEMHDLNVVESKQFEKLLNKKLNEMGLIETLPSPTEEKYEKEPKEEHDPDFDDAAGEEDEGDLED